MQQDTAIQHDNRESAVLLTAQEPQAQLPTKRQKSTRVIRFVALLLGLALISSGLLLLYDSVSPFTTFLAHIAHAPLSAIPLLSIGIAYLLLQTILRPHIGELLKRLMVASAFIFWGIDQLLPGGLLATALGDIVIVLYIIDLAFLINDALKHAKRAR